MRYAPKIISILPFFIVTAVNAETPARSELKVTLFGQPCLMQGPQDSATLKTIHAISPEQLYPIISSEELQKSGLSQQIKGAMSKLAMQSKTPTELDRYRERLGKRLEALSAFVNGLQLARKQHRAEPLLAATRPFFRTRNPKAFESLARKFTAQNKADVDRSGELLDQLYDLYSEVIEPDPEEEFHRAIRKLGVKYACSYEDSPEISETTGHASAPE